jgi:hypothetical protein
VPFLLSLANELALLSLVGVNEYARVDECEWAADPEDGLSGAIHDGRSERSVRAQGLP